MLHTKAMTLNHLLKFQDAFIGIAFCCISGCFCSHIKNPILKWWKAIAILYESYHTLGH